MKAATFTRASCSGACQNAAIRARERRNPGDLPDLAAGRDRSGVFIFDYT
jgi:hypothetical protein